MNFPVKAKAVVLPAYNKNLIRAILSLRIEEIEVPAPGPEEVLVEMLATPVNPSDIAFMQGTYNIVKPLPAIPGFEGVGIVRACGSRTPELSGKRVAVFVQEQPLGCWSSAIVVHHHNLIVLDDKLSMEQAAALSINPLTALGMFERAEQHASDTLVLNAAGGQVPEFVRAMAAASGKKVINIFRKRSSIEGIEALQQSIKLFSEDEDFEQQLRDALQGEVRVTALDAVGGSYSGQLFNALPEASLLLVYGGLSNENLCGINTIDLIFNKKSIAGFNLNHYLDDLRRQGRFEELTQRLQQMIMDGEVNTRIQAVLPVEQLVDGLRTYIKGMSKGKVILTFKHLSKS